MSKSQVHHSRRSAGGGKVVGATHHDQLHSPDTTTLCPQRRHLCIFHYGGVSFSTTCPCALI